MPVAGNAWAECQHHGPQRSHSCCEEAAWPAAGWPWLPGELSAGMLAGRGLGCLPPCKLPGSAAGRWLLTPALSHTTALLFRVRMMKKKGRKCPHLRRHPCHLLCPQLQTRSLSGRTMTQRVGSVFPPHASQTCLFPGWLEGACHEALIAPVSWASRQGMGLSRPWCPGTVHRAWDSTAVRGRCRNEAAPS